MRTPAWKRLAARTVLVTFTTCFVGCGGSPSETPSTTTVPVPPTTMAPATLPLSPPPPPPPSTTPTLPTQAPEQLGKQELRDLVAPVALYPDVVLASLLPATTNADQVHDAAQYVGSAAHVDRVPDDRGWDGSVIGLLQFPDVLRWLDANPAWTDEMGQAVTYQQGDVLQAIQDYRRAAQDVGNLKANQYQKVRSAPNRDIVIEPARPDVVYVPSYDPVQATQPQPAQASPGINPWIAFGGGAVVGALGAWALYSIFDNDDDNHTTVNNYYGGGRKIRSYDNYYYAGRRRPRPVDWTPRARQYRQHPQGWQQTQRLQHAATSTRPGKSSAALRPPTTGPAGQAVRPGQVKREQQVQRREERQQQQLQRKQQQQDQKQQQRQQRQEHKQEQHQKQQIQQQQQEGRRQEQQKKREMQQEQQRQNQQQRQEKKQAQRDQQKEQKQQNQKQQAQKEQNQSERGSDKGQTQNTKQNKKKNKTKKTTQQQNQ